MKKLLFILLSFAGFTNMNSQVYYMCSGTTSSSATSGTIYDSGGPNGNYTSYENCFFLIKAGCPGNITINFSSFSTESGYDYLAVYNGSTTSSPVLGSWWGTGQVPSMTANSGYMLLEFYSDGSTNMPGFAATWNFSSQGCPPVAAINYSVNTCQGKVNFSDASTFSPNSWLWNFGDGNASSLQNPVYTYTAPGTYSVTLVSTNNFGSSTITRTVAVNPIQFNIGYNGAPVANAAMSFTTDNTSGQVYTWNFGDNKLAGTANAIHTYTAMGTYTVGLTIASGSCVTTTTMQLVINDIVGVKESTVSKYNVIVQPNPFEGSTQLNLQLAENCDLKIEVLNTTGQVLRVVHADKLEAGQYEFEIKDIPAGINFISITEGQNKRMLKLISIK